MKCTKCGKELDENVKCCDECGTQVCKPVIEHTAEMNVSSQSKDLLTKIKNLPFVQKINELPKKQKIITGIGGALIIVLLFVFLGSLGSKPANGGNSNSSSYNTPNVPANENFGKNEEITAVPTEEITQPDIEIVYPEIVCSYGNRVKIVDCEYVYKSDNDVQFVFTVEKVADCDGPKIFAADIYYYDSQNHLIESEQALYIFNFKDGSIGKQYRCVSDYFSSLNDNKKVAKVEIFGR